jgi:hypothetical protein
VLGIQRHQSAAPGCSQAAWNIQSAQFTKFTSGFEQHHLEKERKKVAAARMGFPKIPFAQVRVALAGTIGILAVNS